MAGAWDGLVTEGARSESSSETVRKYTLRRPLAERMPCEAGPQSKREAETLRSRAAVEAGAGAAPQAAGRPSTSRSLRDRSAQGGRASALSGGPRLRNAAAESRSPLLPPRWDRSPPLPP